MSSIGRYELVGRVSAGPGSAVWKGVDPDTGAAVALKRVTVLPEQVRREAAGPSRLSHPNVVAVREVVEDADGPCLVSEWVEGANLGAVLAAGETLSEQQAVATVVGALAGLAHAHGLGVAHGDVSPSNIMVTPAGESRLLDFGLAGVRGAAAYKAPEDAVSLPGDVYAMAAVLVHLLTGSGGQPTGDRRRGGRPSGRAGHSPGARA